MADTLERYMRDVYATAKDVGKDLDPDGDWIPMLLCDKGGKQIVVGIATGQDDVGADIVSAIRLVTEKEGPFTRAALLTTAWAVARGIGERLPEGNRVSEQADRFEIIQITGVDMKDAMVGVAHVTRSDKAPVLGELDLQHTALSGRLVRALYEAVR